MHRITFRMPIWAALALVGAAYVLRSIVVRGGDFSVDATDLVAAAAVGLGLTLVALTRRHAESAPQEPPSDDPAQTEEGVEDRG